MLRLLGILLIKFTESLERLLGINVSHTEASGSLQLRIIGKQSLGERLLCSSGVLLLQGLLIILHTLRLCGFRHGQQTKQHRDRSDTARQTPMRPDRHAEQQQQKSGDGKIHKNILRHPIQRHLLLVLLEILCRGSGKLRNIRPGPRCKIATARLLGKANQRFGVQFTDDMFTGRIAPQTSVGRRIRNRRAARGTDPHGDDVHTLLEGLLRSGIIRVDRILTVTENNESISPARRTAAEIIQRPGQHQPEVRPPVAGPPGIHPLQNVPQSVVIIGQRHHHIRLTGEHDQADLVPRERIQQLQGRRARLLQAARGHIIRRHGARNIQRNEQITPRGMSGGLREPRHGPRQGQNPQHQCP